MYYQTIIILTVLKFAEKTAKSENIFKNSNFNKIEQKRKNNEKN